MVSGPKNSQWDTHLVIERGQHIYDERLKALLEPAHNGKFVVIDVETGEYEVDSVHRAASDRAFAKHPGALLFATRVGSPTLGRMGLHSSVSGS